MKTQLVEKIEQKTFVVGIIGLGYIGLPLLYHFTKQGFTTIGLDVDTEKVDLLNQGKSYIGHIPSEKIREILDSGRAEVTTNYSQINVCDGILIAVPTPLTPNREPNMSYVVSTCEAIYPNLRSGQIIILESTTYPGTTTELVVPILERSGLKVSTDFLVAYSPEREDPANKEYATDTIPKVVGAISPDGLAVAIKLYDQIVKRTVPVSSTKIAEMTKLLENIFRSVNIALVNELKVALMNMGIDIWEVIEAASTKPFGFMPFYPGPGLGGHCIPLDPFYLTWKAREYGVNTKFIELAGEINSSMPDFVITRVMEALNDRGMALKGARVLLLGIAYKPNMDDDRESPSYHLLEKLERLGAQVSYNDPHIPEIRPSQQFSQFAGRKSVPITGDCDLILIATAHDEYREVDFVDLGVPVVDTRNVVRVESELVYKA